MSEKQHYQRLLQNGSVEVRAIGEKVYSGVYNNYDAMRSALIWAEKKGLDAYTTINPLKIPAKNDPLKAYQRGARDADVMKISSIFFDFDPVRPTGTAATEEMIQLAQDQLEKLTDYLADEHWGTPTTGFSGNGWHAIYATDMDVDDIGCLRGLYNGLEKRFGTEEVVFDIMVKNPSRICRAYGTTNRKANRRSQCWFSDHVTAAPYICNLAESITPPKEKPKHWVGGDKSRAGKHIKNLDVVQAFSQHGLYLMEANEPNKHYVTCLWADEHSETGPKDTVVWQQEFPTFHCSHNHCAHRDITDVIATWGLK